MTMLGESSNEIEFPVAPLKALPPVGKVVIAFAGNSHCLASRDSEGEWRRLFSEAPIDEVTAWEALDRLRAGIALTQN